MGQHVATERGSSKQKKQNNGERISGATLKIAWSIVLMNEVEEYCGLLIRPGRWVNAHCHIFPLLMETSGQAQTKLSVC